MGCLYLIISFLLFTFILGMMGVESVGAVIAVMILSAIGILYWEKTKSEKEEEKKNEIQRKEYIHKNELLKEYGLPVDCSSYNYIGGHSAIANKKTMNVWVEDSNLNFLAINDREKHIISLGDINFYSIKGDVRQETEIKGGDMTVVETAIAEGLVGTAAAMKRNQVTQNVKIIDERKTIINAILDGKESFIFFEGANLYNYLLENIPGKEQSFVAMNNRHS